MTVEEARSIKIDFARMTNPTEEDVFLFTETMEYLISAENDPEDMMYLGGYYYEICRFDLALKYYEMASALDYDDADVGLGYIWYYGRTGERDFKKAFEYFSRSMKRGNLNSAYKVADMYKNGYYVQKDYPRYVAMIEELFSKIQNAQYVEEPLPEIFTRLARIRTEQGRLVEAVQLYFFARDFLAQRIQHNAFFGNLNIMKWLEDDLYELVEFDEDNFGFYDLYYLLRSPVKVHFQYGSRTLEVVAVLEEGNCVIQFGDKWYRDRDEFFKKADIDGKRLTAIYDQLKKFEVVG